jgi:hypothetical protein
MSATLGSHKAILKERYMSKKHPGFKNVQDQIASKQGLSQRQAGAILAKRTREASPSAKKKNPYLRKVLSKK